MSSLEDKLKKYYSSKSLSDEKAELLLGGNKQEKRPYRVYGTIAASIILLVLIVYGTTSLPGNSLEMNVVKEIAMNHNKQLVVEYSSSNLKDLGDKLTKLDFNLIDADSEISGHYELLGGRYCSIQGNLAAQLKIQNNASNKIETLYISGLNPELDRIKPIDIDFNGVNIRLWKHNGLLYGAASDI